MARLGAQRQRRSGCADGRAFGETIALNIGHAAVELGGRRGHAFAMNGTVPGPLLRLKEGQNLKLAVTNHLDEVSSIYWHGLLLPFQMDGVPGVSFSRDRAARHLHL